MMGKHLCARRQIARELTAHAARRSAEISLYVDKECRGKKVGERLVARILEESRKQGDRFHTFVGKGLQFFVPKVFLDHRVINSRRDVRE